MRTHTSFATEFEKAHEGRVDYMGTLESHIAATNRTLTALQKKYEASETKCLSLERVWRNYQEICVIDNMQGNKISNAGTSSTRIDIENRLELIYDKSRSFALSPTEENRIEEFRSLAYGRLNNRSMTKKEYDYIMQTCPEQVVRDLIKQKGDIK